MEVSPLISVIIATYNRSNALYYTIQSVLWQTFQDFELLVVGDGCTDDSEQVVKSFGDARVHWHNLPENSGNQSLPNNYGLQAARGPYVAYLGHDDLWHPDHLQVLIDALRMQQADLVYSIAAVSDPGNKVLLTGLTFSGEYEPRLWVPPSSFMHKRDMIEDTGIWRDYRELYLPPDIEFVQRAWETGKLLRFVPELTVFKIRAGTRRNVYNERPSHEQAQYLHLIQHEPEFRYRELLRGLCTPEFLTQKVFTFRLPEDARPGSVTEDIRIFRGLPPHEPLPIEMMPTSNDLELMRAINEIPDIAPANGVQILHHGTSLPQDGLFVGQKWSFRELDEENQPFRWVENDAEIIVTNPTGDRKRLLLEISPGPGIRGNTFILQLRHDGQEIAQVQITQMRQIIEFDLPLKQGERSIFQLHSDDGGQTIPTDLRILNFRIHRFAWSESENA